MDLFQSGDFILHSGQKSSFKIECDALTKIDWKTLAKIVSQHYNFHTVVGVPRGGLPFAEALEEFKSNDGDYFLIVDDVLTTGKSMLDMLDKILSEGERPLHIQGVVVFSRIPQLPPWIDAIWKPGWRK